MGLDVTGTLELQNDLAEMANRLGPTSAEFKAIMERAAQPIYQQMRANATSDPKSRSGTLLGAIKIGKLSMGKSGSPRITIGVHKGEGGAFYANPVERGHGGPHPAPPHPFVRPAFDARSEEAYGIIRNELQKALRL